MGTAAMSATITPMEKQKKPNILRVISTLFQKKNKKEPEKKPEEPKTEYKPLKVTSVATLLKDFQKVEIKDKDDDNKSDEFNQFSFTKTTKAAETSDTETEVLKPSAARSGRYGSHTSQDSGYAEHDQNEVKDDKDDKDDIVKKFKDLKIGKETKLHTVYISRGPKKRVSDIVGKQHPYARNPDNYRQICRVPVNTNIYTGGQVIVKPNTDLSEINQALSTIENNVQNFPESCEQQSLLWQTAQEFVTEDSSELPEDIYHDYIQMLCVYENYTSKEIDPLEEFNNTLLNIELNANHQGAYLTPPYSENLSSPVSANLGSPVSINLGSPQLTNSEYILSPDRLSPIYSSDLEKYQDITTEVEKYQEIPKSHQEVHQEVHQELMDSEKKKPKASSGSLMTMKQYKDLQKELLAEFAKLECCQMSRKPCREIFEDHAKKLTVEERRGLCVKLSQLDTKSAYGVLQQILLFLSTGSSKEENLQCALFSLLCERVLGQRPSLFLGDFGFELLKSATLRCHRRPLFTRYLVQCVRTALRLAPNHMEGRDSVFHETDALGDTLVTACARAGDACAAVLAELVRDSPPLFRLAHANTEGYTALHVACVLHSAAAPRLHIAHVLLEHGKADLWAGDVKGGDTALHLAVNSSTCSLRLVMALFRHVERARWRQLAHAPNRSSVTPLEYARSQTKSISRPYPQEVLDFLKKCR